MQVSTSHINISASVAAFVDTYALAQAAATKQRQALEARVAALDERVARGAESAAAAEAEQAQLRAQLARFEEQSEAQASEWAARWQGVARELEAHRGEFECKVDELESENRKLRRSLQVCLRKQQAAASAPRRWTLCMV